MKKIKKRLFKAICFGTVFITLFSLGSLSALALNWDGSFTAGSGGSNSAGSNGYAIRTTGDNCIGYRFSVVDKFGDTFNKVIDIFRNTSYGNSDYSSALKFNSKLNKKQLINEKNNNFRSSISTTDCFREVDMGFVDSLPTPGGMDGWQKQDYNLNPVLRELKINEITGLNIGDKVLVEPLYSVRIEGSYHSVTVSELAVYGRHKFGDNSDGGASNNSESWGFISAYTNRIYPNSMYTPDGQGLWGGVGALGGRGTFSNILNNGYDVGIAYSTTGGSWMPALTAKYVDFLHIPGGQTQFDKHYGTSYSSSPWDFVVSAGYPVKDEVMDAGVCFNYEEGHIIRVRQTVGWYETGKKNYKSVSRDVVMHSGNVDSYYFNLKLTGAVTGDEIYRNVYAKMEWLNEDGSVAYTGQEKTFSVPIAPKVNATTEMFDITGARCAFNGVEQEAGYLPGTERNTGAVYAGQKVSARYRFMSESPGTNVYLRSYPYFFKNGSWNYSYPNDNGADLLIDNRWTSSGGGIEQDSKLSQFIVPTSALFPNNYLSFIMQSFWGLDISHTKKENTRNIEIYTPDLELHNIYLVDEKGNRLMNNYILSVGQTVTPQYEYKNNTGVDVYANGYDTYGNKIGGTYKVPDFNDATTRTVRVNGSPITLTNDNDLKVWGGVYLDDMGKGNTNYEKQKTNNEKTIIWKVKYPFEIEPIIPNAPYRTQTDVLTSFKVKNNSNVNAVPGDKVSVKFTVKANITQEIYTVTKNNIVIPMGGENLVYFKWRAVGGSYSEDMILSAEILKDGKVMDKTTMKNRFIKKDTMQTPDTVFEYRPWNYFKTNEPTPNTVNSEWSMWIYENNTFVKKNYGVGYNTLEIPNLTASNMKPASTKIIDNIWNMRSGYGFYLSCLSVPKQLNGFITAPSDSITPIQTAFAYFPEFGYKKDSNKYRALVKATESDGIANVFRFVENPYGDNLRIHFSPLWVRP